MQLDLLGNEEGKGEIKVEIKESFDSFIVISPDSCSYPNKKENGVRRWKKKKVESYELKSVAKSDFEKQVINDYKIDSVIWVESKYKDSQGFFFLDGIKIHWILKFDSCEMYHFGFHCYLSDNKELKHTEYKYGCKNDVDSGRIPCLLTETGYRSRFANKDELDYYDTIEEALIEIIELEINRDETGKPLKKKKKYSLVFSKEKPKNEGQLTLIELQGGGK